MARALHRRVENLEHANPANRTFLYIENEAGETLVQSEARSRREQGIPEDVEPNVTVSFIGLHG